MPKTILTGIFFLPVCYKNILNIACCFVCVCARARVCVCVCVELGHSH